MAGAGASGAGLGAAGSGAAGSVFLGASAGAGSDFMGALAGAGSGAAGSLLMGASAGAGSGASAGASMPSFLIRLRRWLSRCAQAVALLIIISPVYKTGLQLEVSMNMPYTFCCEHEQSR